LRRIDRQQLLREIFFGGHVGGDGLVGDGLGGDGGSMIRIHNLDEFRISFGKNK
jgi:hypothetical protein